MECRKEDPTPRTWFRSNRFFNEGNQWYFATRENTIEGPYSSHEEAESGLLMYLRDIQSMENFGLKPGRVPG